MESPLDIIVALSRHFGSDPQFVLAGGGNTSAKVGQRLFVKGSGGALANITAEGFVEMDRAALEAILGQSFPAERTAREAAFKDAVMASRVHPQRNQRPSVEVVLHHLMPGQFVIHTHPTLVNQLTCCVNGPALAKELLGDDAVWVPDVDPGLVLARTLRDALKDYRRRTGRQCPRAVLMQNHGLVVAGDTAEEVKRHTDWVMQTIGQRLRAAPTEAPFGPVTRMDAAEATRLINTIGPALRGLLSDGPELRIVSFDDSPAVLALVGGAGGQAAAMGGPVMPDQIVYCKSLPLWFDAAGQTDAAALVAALRQAVAAYRSRATYPPLVVLVKGLGMFTAGDDIAAAQRTRAVYSDSIAVMAGARALGGIRYLEESQREFFEKWEVETYRRKVARGEARGGRVANKVALVTGAAQGFGLEIAQDLAAQGAHVVLADLNAEGAVRAAAELAGRYGAQRAIGLRTNVTDAASVAEAIHQAVRLYGGLDLLVSNAGVLKAGSVKTLAERDFDLVTAVNYKGYFLCVQAAAPVMALQHLGQPASWSDIIQINSKSGLEGSNRNGAYAGSKFGGIGLTQSFALELVEDGIKVNAICPGNFFDGPLWSDPDHGLFVQYLRSGKVPGAKTIADVRAFYEAKVPMGRGCATADVMKAIYYLMEQQYETGQAVPVTGGQVMLS